MGKIIKKINKNKCLKNAIITMAIYMFLVVCLYIFKDSVLAKNRSDYINQHTMFIDYIRRNFWATGDLFPQWNMNYGLGQSFVTMDYYGMYNPFVMLAYILPPINPVFILGIIFTILLGLNTAAMTKLLELNNIEGRINTSIAILSSFSGVFIYHMTTHPMFIYYLPIMTLSLVALHYLVEREIKSYYAITVGLIFFTNFTFAPIISVLQFFYFTGLLIESKKFKIKKYIQFIFAYLLGVLSGMLILIPTGAFELFSSARTEPLDPHFDFFSSLPLFIKNVGSNSYASGIFIIAIFAILGTIFVTRKHKHLIILIPMLLILIILPLNYTFNLFQYIHSKIYIMFLPIWWLLFAETIKQGNKLNLGILTISSTFIYFLQFTHNISLIRIIIILICSLLVYLLCVNNQKFITIIVCLALIFISFLNNLVVTPISQIDRFTNANGKVTSEITPYRELDAKNNHLENINTMIPNIYTSLENGTYIQASRLEFETPISSYVRQTKDFSFDNIYFQNLYGIKNKNVDVNPIVYGVLDKNSYNLDTYRKMTSDEKLYAVNQAIFTEESKNTNYENKFNLQPIYTNSGSLKISSNQEKTFKIPKQYQNGVLNISFDADLEHSNAQKQIIKINDQSNQVQYQDRYGINDNTKVTFRISTDDISELNTEITIDKPKPITYSNLKITYQAFEDFNKHKIQVVNPVDFVADLNHSFSFNLKMEDDGYLATTIPYDRGFKIYVDGQQSKVQKIEDLFIGTKLTKGTHSIIIKYNIPGFKIALVLSLIGWVSIAYLFIKEHFKLRTSKL